MRGFDDSAFPPGNRKTHTRVSYKHNEFIKRLQCVICGNQPVEAAHVRMGTDGGAGLKPSSRFLVPLCHAHHYEQHNKWDGSEKLFWEGHKIDPLDVAECLWTLSGDKEGATAQISAIRRRAEERRFSK